MSKPLVRPLPFFALWMLIALLLGLSLQARAAEDETLAQVSALLVQKFDQRARGVALLVEQEHPRTEEILHLLKDGELYYRKDDDRLFIVRSADTGAEALDLLDGSAVIIEKKRDFRKVTLNNLMRGQISQALAELGLKAEDPERRAAAVRELLGALDPDTVAVLRNRIGDEPVTEVRELMAQALAIQDLETGDEAARLQAIERLDGSLEPPVRNALTALLESDAGDQVKRQAQLALNGIDEKIRYYGMLETLYFGISLGSVLVLAGIGLAITFGVMGVINMAHGELIMLGAYTTYVIQQLMPNHIGASILVAIPAAFVVSGLVGIAIERGVIRFLYGRPLETLLATFGISLVLQQAVRSIFSPLNRSVETPDWMSGLVEINPVFSLTLSRLYIILFCLLVFAALVMVLKRTPLGLQVRAVSQNRAMARAMGVRSKWVDALTFGLGSGVAGVAGVALSQLTNVGPNLGQAYIIDSFMVVVFGGVGNLWGTLVAGLSLGVANKVLEPWAGAVLAKILVLVFIILFIQKRPRGLFPQRGRAAEG
ncbi:branched-chain amino acid ABC transporter permease [Marinobacterium nitratireducens]|uniref:Branched-chain amino acid ABC transporter permease n=1 Tax=Marinobacterium nitratireducens TaxID=518897 RepID=A0A917ZFE9_9GAMM|nr:urea ABC transporter permease subunit UrtB [Marinobacterium nitratireducens]GGO82086.1 branched-chain amino acid ABC transporter permease [Marinobacterium nitratireducens]